MIPSNRFYALFFTLAVISTAWSVPPTHGTSSGDCIVNTTSGRVRPLLDPKYPDVEQYLGVPFAQPPIHNLRFAPPHKIRPASNIIDATTLPPGCPQATGSPTEFTIYEPGLSFYGPQSEDCLKLNVYRPKLRKPQEPLPVIIFVYGGGFTSGATNIIYEVPTPWVQAKQDLIVVNIQYRLGFFGFPNSAALDAKNLGLRDIRFAVEWVRDNVGAFGGDPERITLWGHSAGSIATSAYTFSHPNEPIVHSTISTSGTVFTPQVGWQSYDQTGSNFTFVANQLGCSGSAEALLECLRTKETAAINEIVFSPNSTLAFKPMIDGQYVFANYSNRLLAGKLAKQPAIIGNSRDEGERSLDTNTNPNGPNQTLAVEYTIAAFLCPGELMSKLRVQNGLPTYRYEWAGNFSNISPLPWMGAYHASLLPFFFGTTNIKAAHPLSGNSTSFELEVGSHMQDLWRAFAADPISLQNNDWPLYQGGSVNQTTDAVKLFPGSGNELSSITLGAAHEEYCAKIDPFLISQTLPAALQGLADG